VWATKCHTHTKNTQNYDRYYPPPQKKNFFLTLRPTSPCIKASLSTILHGDLMLLGLWDETLCGLVEINKGFVNKPEDSSSKVAQTFAKLYMLSDVTSQTIRTLHRGKTPQTPPPPHHHLTTHAAIRHCCKQIHSASNRGLQFHKETTSFVSELL